MVGASGDAAGQIVWTKHGRSRCQQRGITQSDVQSAIKHGTRERTSAFVWKVTLGRFVHIFRSVNALRRDVRHKTSYALPLDEHSVPKGYIDFHNDIKVALERSPGLCRSHTVLVVNVGKSMQTKDFPLFRSRQDAAYSTLAVEFLEKQMERMVVTHDDVVSLIEFDEDGARVVFRHEPCSKALFNKLLARREASKFGLRRDKRTTFRICWECNGGKKCWECTPSKVKVEKSFRVALRQSLNLLQERWSGKCPIALIVLTDGESDHAKSQWKSSSNDYDQTCREISTFASKHGRFFSMSTFGIGSDCEDFGALRAIAQACNRAPGLARAHFVFRKTTPSRLDDEDETSVTSESSDCHASIVSASSEDTSQVSGLSEQPQSRAPENDAEETEERLFYPIHGHSMYDPRSQQIAEYSCLPPGATGDGFDVKTKLVARNRKPQYLALNTVSIDCGSAKAAFCCQLAETRSTVDTVLDPFVMKQAVFDARRLSKEEFHKTACAAQSIAAFLATEFNKLIANQSSCNPFPTPIIAFTPCSVVSLKRDTSPTAVPANFLVQKMLDTQRLHWRRWVDEAGEDMQSPGDTAPSEYLQAFSHFSYAYTRKKLVVCDLQGVYNTDSWPPVFDLTDPAIHYHSISGRRKVYGSSDEGKAGIEQFCKSHQCSNLCQLVTSGIPKVNWYKKWCNYHESMFGKGD